MDLAKKPLRVEASRYQAALSLVQRQQAARQVYRHLLQWPRWPCMAQAPILCYQAIRGEIAVDALMHLLWRTGGRVVLPRVEGSGLGCYQVPHPGACRQGSFGIREPVPSLCLRLPVGQCALVLVPGLAFDRSGYRLGYGKGFYDRLLAGTQTPFRLGIGYDTLLYETIHPVAHDVPMHAVVTPSGWIEMR